MGCASRGLGGGTRQRTDRELIESCLHEDPKAWAALVDRYADVIYGIAWAFDLPPEDRADVFQSVCLVWLENLDSLRHESTLESWLRTETIRRCQPLVEAAITSEKTSDQDDPQGNFEDRPGYGFRFTDGFVCPPQSDRGAGTGPFELFSSGEPRSGFPDDSHGRLVAVVSRARCSPPEWLLRQAEHLYRWYRMRAGSGTREHIPALLLVDSFADGPLPGFRSAGPVSRLLLYRADRYTVTLSISSSEPTGYVEIIGQSLSPSGNERLVTPVSVELFQDAVLVRAATTNEFGAFLFEGIRPGVYDATIRLSGGGAIDIVGLTAHVHSVEGESNT